jgi:eukaryotic-like serine/threonine-protein kinase
MIQPSLSARNKCKDQDVSALAPGTIVGPYRLLFPLGKGGMGEVWASQQVGLEGFQKMVAVKVLKGKSHTENSKLMFLDEAKTAAVLQHPAIIPTVDLGEHKGMLYIAMDLVQGPSLRGLLQKKARKKETISPAIVAHIGARMAAALDYAYNRAEADGQKLKLIHRDVSPHNILIDTSGAVRLMDFGVARTSIQDHLSSVGTVRGKPSYMAPEQVMGGDLTAQTDVFALGTVLYESASLRRLFGRGEPTKSMAAVVKHFPRTLTELMPGFPADLSDIVAQALQKKPQDRQADAGVLARQLNEVLRDLKGSSTVDRDLSVMVADCFGEKAFDLDTKLAEFAELQIPEPDPVEQTRADRAPPQQQDPENVRVAPQDVAFYEALATNVVWPGAPDTASGFNKHSDNRSYPFSEPPPLVRSTGKGRLSFVLLLAAFILSFALVFGVKRRLDRQRLATPEDSEKSLLLKAKTSNKPLQNEPNTVNEKPKPRPADVVVKPPNKRVIIRKEKTPSSAKRSEPRVRKKARQPATKQAIYALIKRLAKQDPKKAERYQAALIETGAHQERLNSLRTKIQNELERIGQ